MFEIVVLIVRQAVQTCVFTIRYTEYCVVEKIGDAGISLVVIFDYRYVLSHM